MKLIKIIALSGLLSMSAAHADVFEVQTILPDFHCKENSHCLIGAAFNITITNQSNTTKHYAPMFSIEAHKEVHSTGDNISLAPGQTLHKHYDLSWQYYFTYAGPETLESQAADVINHGQTFIKHSTIYVG